MKLKRILILTGLTLEGRNIVNFNEPINLTCLVRGENRAPEDVDWFFNGIKIVSGSSRWRNRVYITRERETYKKEFKSQLLIDNSNFSDTGVFVCRASADLVKSIAVSVLEGKDKLQIFSIRIRSFSLLILTKKCFFNFQISKMYALVKCTLLKFWDANNIFPCLHEAI